MSKRRTGTDPVHTITSTQGPLGEDIDRRARRYLAQMMLRTLCFLGAVLTWGRVPTWLSVGLLVGAVVLPYVAVVLANAGRERPERAETFLDPRAIGGGGPAPLSAPVPPREPGAGWDDAAWERAWADDAWRPTTPTPDGTPRD